MLDSDLTDKAPEICLIPANYKRYRNIEISNDTITKEIFKERDFYGKIL